VANNSPVFITGASGFIGGKIAERLLGEGRRVRVLARRPLPDLEKLGAEVMSGDLADTAALRCGCEGAGTVFHVAGRVGVWGPAEDFFKVNVEGTRNVIAACRTAAVPRLVYTSSPSVVYNGGDLSGVNESAPLCTEAPCAYPTSKAAAEKLVSAAHSKELATVSLRPHLVWGSGDKNVVPRVLELARKGRLKIIGSGQNRVDVTHITNVVDAHLLAERALVAVAGLVEPGPGSSTPAPFIGGKAYFITNGEPVILWDWINQLVRGVGLPEIQKHVSLRTAYLAGGVLESLWRILPLKGEPPMTRFVAKEMATDHWFDISAARRELGYTPRVSVVSGTAELIAHIKQNPA
jgi:nucleoside-diphosphate-sugar epimerase